MDLHELIMKIKITSACIGYAVEEAMKYDNDLEIRLALAYKIGFQDARQAAAAVVDNQQQLANHGKV